MNYVRLSNLSLKYLKFTPSGCKDIGMSKFEFVTNFLCNFLHWYEDYLERENTAKINKELLCLSLHKSVHQFLGWIKKQTK